MDGVRRSFTVGPNASFGLYLGGIALVIGGASYGAAMFHVPAPWIVAGGIVLLGLGVLAAVKAANGKGRD